MKKETQNSLAFFENFKIRRHYDEKSETWYFSVIDIIAALIEQPNFQMARKYWNKLAERLKNEGSELVTKCHRLKMLAQDGKMRETDVADVKQYFDLFNLCHPRKPSRLKFGLPRLVMNECRRCPIRRRL